MATTPKTDGWRESDSSGLPVTVSIQTVPTARRFAAAIVQSRRPDSPISNGGSARESNPPRTPKGARQRI